MDRLISVLLLVLIVAVLGVGAVIWRADQQAREDRAEFACLQRAQATATVAALAPPGRIDSEGRIEAMRALGQRLEAC